MTFVFAVMLFHLAWWTTVRMPTVPAENFLQLARRPAMRMDRGAVVAVVATAQAHRSGGCNQQKTGEPGKYLAFRNHFPS